MTNICKTNIAPSYHMKLAEPRDQLGAIEVKDDELVWIDVDGYNSSWHNFVHIIFGREKLPNFKKLWDAFIGEEMRLEQVSTNYKNEDDGQDLALTSKVRRGGTIGGTKSKQKDKKEESNSSCPSRYQVLQVQQEWSLCLLVSSEE